MTASTTRTALGALGACAGGAGFDGHSPQVAERSARTGDALRACLTARLARFGAPAIEEEPRRVVLRYRQATIVINDLTDDVRSIEAWREGPRDRPLWRDILACK